MGSQQSFVLSCSEDQSNSPSTRVSCTTTQVPAGKRWIVEHISGYFVVGTGYPVDLIWATDDFGQSVYLPTHFASRELNFGGNLGIARYYQFGSPVRMYIEAGRSITINGDANIAGEISATMIGYLEDQ